MNELKIFNFDNRADVRTTQFNGEPYLCLKDVCDILEINNVSQCKTRLKEDGIITSEVIDSMGRAQSATFINEQNLYKVIFQSRKPEAEAFQDWVTGEVLPTIRRTGNYGMPKTYAEALRAYADEVEQKERLILENNTMKPKAEFYDAVADSKTAIPMDQVAKVLAIPGIGRNKLFELLRNMSILQSNNIPYQTYIDRGYFRTIETKYTKPNGDTCINIKTLVYQKGIDYIRSKVTGASERAQYKINFKA
jgi:prophage antirepressor-like protein